MVKEIQLTLGKVALVDDEDFEELNKYLWAARRHRKTFYAFRCLPGTDGDKHIQMHKQILGSLDGFKTDHINGDGLDNRKSNLRYATNSQNLCNRGRQRNNTSGYKGVCWHRRIRKWNAKIVINGKTIHLGYFDFKEDAARAYNEAAKRLHDDFAQLNEIPAPDTDDTDGNGLDNQPCINSQNSRIHRRSMRNTSGYIGVSYHKQGRKWEARISVNGKRIRLGCFDSKEDAARAYNEAAKQAWGNRAWLNEIPRQD